MQRQALQFHLARSYLLFVAWHGENYLLTNEHIFLHVDQGRNTPPGAEDHFHYLTMNLRKIM